MAAIGAPLASSQPSDKVGMIHLYRLNASGNWDHDTSLLTDPLSDTALYGSDVELDGDILAGGAFNGTSGCLETGGRVELTSVSGSICRSLTATPDSHSLSTGGTTLLTLDAGPQFAGQPYIPAGSLSGTNPGLIFDHSRIPLNGDEWFLFTILYANTGAWMDNIGVLDGNGCAPAQLNPNVAKHLSESRSIGLFGQ